jgi:Skp family chaperone for outer membrane proteins
MAWKRAAAGVLAMCLAFPAVAQEVPAPSWPVLVLRQDDLFERSAFGLASTARIETANAALLAENREIESALEIEERDLTLRRSSLPPAEFQALAEAFNAKVEGIRAAQDAKSRDIARSRDEDRQRFLQAAVPVLAAIMQEEGAQAILDEQAVVLSFDRIDITDKAIARINAAIGDGSALPSDAAPDTTAPAP